MKKRNNRLNKKIILVAATVLVVGGAGTGVTIALQSDEPKKAPEQFASLEAKNEPVEQAAQEATQTQPQSVQEQLTGESIPETTTDQQTTEQIPTVQTITQCIVNDSITETETGGSAKVTVYTIEHYSDGSTKVYSPYNGSYPVPPGPPAFCPNNQAPSP